MTIHMYICTLQIPASQRHLKIIICPHILDDEKNPYQKKQVDLVNTYVFKWSTWTSRATGFGWFLGGFKLMEMNEVSERWASQKKQAQVTGDFFFSTWVFPKIVGFSPKSSFLIGKFP